MNDLMEQGFFREYAAETRQTTAWSGPPLGADFMQFKRRIMTCGGNHIELFLASKVRGAETGRIPENIVAWRKELYMYAREGGAIYLFKRTLKTILTQSLGMMNI